MCITSYFIHPYKPKFDFHLGKAKELFGFGKWILGSSILVFLLTQGDDIFVGKLLGATALGLYQLAYRISNMPATEITHVISQVTFPAYSKLQDNLPKLREAYLRTLQLTAFLSIPIAGLIFVLAPDFTRIFLGEKWMPMVPAMQVLAIWGLIRSIGATTGPVFQGVGRPEITAKLQLIQLVLMIVLIYPLTIQLGILGTSAAIVIAAIIANIVGYYMILEITKCGLWDFLKMVGFPLINTLIIVLFVATIDFQKYFGGLLGLLLAVLIGIFIYIFITTIFDKVFNYQLMNLIRSFI